MFEDRTPDNIRAEILAAMEDRVQTREGSFAAEMAGPVAVEAAMIYQALAAMLSAFYVDESSGGFIDVAASRYGIVRKAGGKAVASIYLTGRPQTTIPAGTVFLTENGLEYALDTSVILDGNGQGEGMLTALEVGDSYNVPAGAITQMALTMTGLNSWTSGVATGGTDPETDKDLVGRLYDYWQKPSTSGNAYDYQKWALEVDGVGAAKVFPVWNGPGTVKVLLAGPERRPVEQNVISATAKYIEALRPVGAAVTVESAGNVEINVSATLTLDGSATLADIKAEFVSKLEAYLQELAFERYTVPFNRIAFLLLDVDGVADYAALMVNGGTENVVIPANGVPTVGAVDLE